MVEKRSIQEEIELLTKERDELEREIDLTVFGQEAPWGEGNRPSMSSYAETIWEEEILLDPDLAGRLALARETQREVRLIDKQISDLKEEIAQENSL